MNRFHEFLEGPDQRYAPAKLGEMVGIALCTGLAIASFIDDRDITMDLVYSVLTLAGVRGALSGIVSAAKDVKIEQARQGIQPASTVVTQQPAVTVNAGTKDGSA